MVLILCKRRSGLSISVAGTTYHQLFQLTSSSLTKNLYFESFYLCMNSLRFSRWSCCNWRSCPLFPEARPCQSTTLVLNLKPELSPTCISSCRFNFDIGKINRFLSLRHPVFFSSSCICVFCSIFPGFILTDRKSEVNSSPNLVMNLVFS